MLSWDEDACAEYTFRPGYPFGRLTPGGVSRQTIPLQSTIPMIEDTATLLNDPGSELVLALVGAAGADLEEFERLLIDLLKRHQYEARSIRLSSLLRSIGSTKLGIELEEAPEAERLRTYMDAGDKLRKKTNASEALALWAMADIAADRAGQGRKKRCSGLIAPMAADAYCRGYV